MKTEHLTVLEHMNQEAQTTESDVLIETEQITAEANDLRDTLFRLQLEVTERESKEEEARNTKEQIKRVAE